MQVEVKHIRGGKRRGGKGTDKQLVDGAIPLDTNGGVRGCSRMGRDHQAHLGSSGRQGNGRAIVEDSCHPAFWMGADLIWSTEQSRPHHLQIEQVVSPTSHDHAQMSREYVEEGRCIT